MTVIKIKSTIKISDFDKLYNDLYFLINQKSVVDIELPKQINKNFFSITSSLIQFVATWVRYSTTGKLLIDFDNEENQLIKLYEEEYFFPIVALVWNDVEIVNLTGRNLRSILREHQNKFILKMRQIKPLKGEKLILANLDHFDNYSGVLPFFELESDFITIEKDLQDSLRSPIMENVLKLNRNSRDDFDGIFNDIVGIIFELMKNTFEWAKNDEFHVPFSPNIRGLYIRFYRKNRNIVLSDYKRSKPIREYFEDEDAFDRNDLGQIYFIEISVFDSGSGFVKKFKINDTNGISDVDIIKKCLIKNQTSSTGIFRNSKGIGLDRILKILNNKGLIKIATDKYCLYRNLIKSPYEPIIAENFRNVELKDWWTQSKTFFTESKMTSGTNISILYPLSQRSKIK